MNAFNRLLINIDNKELVYSLLIKSIYTLINPISAIILARILGSEQLGTYSFVLSVMTLLSVPTTFGLPTVIVRFSSKYYHNNEITRLKGLFRYSNIITISLSISIVLLLLMALRYNILDFDSNIILGLYLGLPLIILMSLNSLRSASLKGISEVIIGQIPDMILRPLIFIVTVLIYYNINGSITMTFAIIGMILSYTISYIYGSYVLQNKLPNNYKKVKSEYDSNDWLKSALPLLLVGSVQVLGGQIDIILLGLFRSSDEVGIYKVAFQSAILVTIGISAINTVIAPKISILYYENKINILKSLIYKYNRVIIFISSPIALLLLLFGDQFIKTLFGEEYIMGYTPLIILVFGRLVDAIFGVITVVVKMTGYEKSAAFGIVIGSVVNLVLNLLLIPKYGLVGAALASTFGLITWNIYLYMQCVKKININILNNI